MNRFATTVKQLDDELTDRICNTYGITLMEYKTIRFVFRAAGIAVVSISIILELDVTPISLLVLAAFVLGPDIVEAYLTR